MLIVEALDEMRKGEIATCPATVISPTSPGPTDTGSEHAGYLRNGPLGY
jgi:hypothetical protein